MSNERIWNVELAKGLIRNGRLSSRVGQLTATIVPADRPGMLRATLIENGAVLEHILLPQEQLGELVLRLAGAVPKLVVGYSKSVGRDGGTGGQGTPEGPITPPTGPRGWPEALQNGEMFAASAVEVIKTIQR